MINKALKSLQILHGSDIYTKAIEHLRSLILNKVETSIVSQYVQVRVDSKRAYANSCQLLISAKDGKAMQVKVDGQTIHTSMIGGYYLIKEVMIRNVYEPYKLYIRPEFASVSDLEKINPNKFNIKDALIVSIVDNKITQIYNPDPNGAGKYDHIRITDGTTPSCKYKVTDNDHVDCLDDDETIKQIVTEILQANGSLEFNEIICSHKEGFVSLYFRYNLHKEPQKPPSIKRPDDATI